MDWQPSIMYFTPINKTLIWIWIHNASAPGPSRTRSFSGQRLVERLSDREAGGNHSHVEISMQRAGPELAAAPGRPPGTGGAGAPLSSSGKGR